MPRNKFLVYVVSFLAILLWGLSYIWSNQLLSLEIPVEYFVFIRVLLAGILLLAFNLLTKQRIRIAKKDIPLFCLLALCEPMVYFVCETYGIALTESPTYSALVIASTPIFSVAAGLLFLKERINLVNALGILICLAGIVLVTFCCSSTGKYFILGVVLLLIAVLSEVGHASCTKSLSRTYSPQVIVMYQFLIGSLYMLPLFLTRGLRDFDSSLYLSAEVFKPIICLAVLCSSLAFSLWVSTIKHLGVAKSSICLAMIPVVTAVAGSLLGQESLSAQQWLGVALAAFGVVLSQWAFKKSTNA